MGRHCQQQRRHSRVPPTSLLVNHLCTMYGGYFNSTFGGRDGVKLRCLAYFDAIGTTIIGPFMVSIM